jgi:hypothetical protein
MTARALQVTFEVDVNVDGHGQGEQFDTALTPFALIRRQILFFYFFKQRPLGAPASKVLLPFV